MCTNQNDTRKMMLGQPRLEHDMGASRPLAEDKVSILRPRRARLKWFGTWMALALALLIFRCEVLGAEVKVTPYRIDGGRAFLAGGGLFFGIPIGDATVNWDLTPVNGELIARASVSGSFHRMTPARVDGRITEVGLRIDFKTINAAGQLQTVASRNVFVGSTFGRGDLNIVQSVGVSESFSDRNLAAVTLTTFEMDRSRNPVNERTVTDLAPRLWNFSPNINNGAADFGSGQHFLSGPQANGAVNFFRSVPGSTLNPVTPLGSILGQVIGTLYWDDLFSGGTARLVINFQDANGNTLATRTRDVTGPGTNANNSSNKRSINETFSSPSLFQIRLRTGRVSNGNFVNVTDRTFRIQSSAAGTFDLLPSTDELDVHQRLNYAFTWTVPTPQNWHNLRTLRLRLRDGDDTVFSVLFDESKRTFALENENIGHTGQPYPAGIDARLENNYAVLYLQDSSVVAAGPTSPSVTLNLSLGFKPRAEGKTFVVEVAGSDDLGNEDTFTARGSVMVSAEGSTPDEPTLIVTATKDTIKEGGMPAAIILKLNKGASDDLIVRYTLGGQASIKSDYTGPSAKLFVEIPKGKTTFRIPIRPADDTSKESEEDLIFKLSKNDRYKIGKKKAASIRIKDND